MDNFVAITRERWSNEERVVSGETTNNIYVQKKEDDNKREREKERERESRIDCCGAGLGLYSLQMEE